MNRLCERPGCSAPAEVAYGFDADLLIVWLDALAEVQGRNHGVLCRRHADAMIVPLGWMLDDRREPTLRLFKAPAVEVTKQPVRRERRPRDETGEQLRLDAALLDQLDATELVGEVAIATHAVEAADAEPQPEPSPESTPQSPDDPSDEVPDEVPAWVPVFDPADDLHGLLKARGRLLSRAFNGAPTDS